MVCKVHSSARTSQFQAKLAKARGFREPSMKYVEEVLQPGETVLFVSTIHWLVYWPALLLIVAAIATDLLAASGHEFLRWISLLCLATGLVSAAGAWFKRWTTEIAVTDRRIIYKRS